MSSTLYYESMGMGSNSTARRHPPSSYHYNVKSSAMDTNIIIVTASLLVLLMSSLCMHFLIRWVLSHYWMFNHTDELDAPTSSAPCGLKPKHINALPTIVLEIAKTSTSCHVGCAICLLDFKDGDHLRVMPTCNHGFHIGCIDTWLAKHSSCPTCRGNPLDASSVVISTQNVQLNIVK